jgi:hypothetical protein
MNRQCKPQTMSGPTPCPSASSSYYLPGEMLTKGKMAGFTIELPKEVLAVC